MKKIVLILLLSSLIYKCTAQQYLDTICWVKVIDVNYMPTEGDSSQINSLNTLFDNFNVHFYRQALPFAKNTELLKICEIRSEGALDERNIGRKHQSRPIVHHTY